MVDRRASEDLRQYDRLMEIDHPRFVWMNYGLWSDDFSWIKYPEDISWKYQVNLARFNVRGMDLKGASVLDTGSGRGGNCSYILRYHDPARVVGLDQNGRQVEWCNQRFSDSRVNFIQGDAQSIDLPSGEFDVVTNIESATHYADRRAFYSEVHRVLNDGGYFCHSCNYGNIASVQNDLISSGFSIIQFEDITDDVVRALRDNGDDLRALLCEIAAPSAAGTAISLYRELTFNIPKMFNDDYRYASWILKKI